jgi:cAMP phosphodiesterase
VKLRILGAYGGVAPGFVHTTSFQLNKNILLDAGAAASMLSLKEQRDIDYIFISHTHLDHVKDICFLADNVFAFRRRPVELISTFEILDTLRKHLFNNKIWPDFTNITNGHCPILQYRPIERAVQIGSVKVELVPVHHPVPAVGFLVRDKAGGSIVISGDTGPTELLWQVANEVPKLKAVFTEIAFPNRMKKIALAAGHFTPQLFQEELSKLKRDVPLLIYHLKPEYMKDLLKEIKAMEVPRLKLLEGNQRFTF